MKEGARVLFFSPEQVNIPLNYYQKEEKKATLLTLF